MSTSRIRLVSPSVRQTGAPGALGTLAALLHEGLTTTVPCEYVHRAAVAEVMPTGWARLDDTRFSIRAQWPRSHTFFGPNPEGRYESTIVAETIRQSGLLLCHAELGVPLGHQFLMHDLSFHVEPDQLLVGDVPADLLIDVECTEIKRRGNALTSVVYEVVILRDGELLATGGASTTVISPQVYRRIRSEALRPAGCDAVLTALADPARVGRTSPMDVVLSPLGDPDRWQLRVDTRHPVLFDHPVDHIPGMTLVEAARQAAAAALDRPDATILGIACTFTRYAELDQTCLIETCRLPRTSPEADDQVLVTGRQGDEQVFSATVTAHVDDDGAPLHS